MNQLVERKLTLMRRRQQSKMEIGTKFLTTLFSKCSEGFVEIRSIPPGNNDRFWIPVNNIKIPKLPDGKNTYFGVATRRQGKGTKQDILEIPSVWVDIDFKDVPLIEAETRLKDFPLEPTIIIHSGGGWHLYWMLKEPATPEDINLVEDVNRRIATYFSGDSAAADASRILRLPGTMNVKYDPPRLVKSVSSDPDLEYNLSDFADFLPQQKREIRKDPPGYLSDAELAGVAEGSRNQTAARLTGRFLSKGLSLPAIHDLLQSWNQRNRPPLPESELHTVIGSVFRTRQNSLELQDNDLQAMTAPPMNIEELIVDSVIHVKDFQKLKMPERPYIIKPWLRAGTIAMVYAARGIGKTWLSMMISLSVTRKASIANWNTETPGGCLYIDGEMPCDLFQWRMDQLTKMLPEEKAPLYIMSSDLMKFHGHGYPNIAKKEWRDAITKTIVEVGTCKAVILDNLASLALGINENSKQDWEEINQWLLELRSLRVAVIMVHHSGKSGDQRGTSFREDNIDTTIKLTRPSDYDEEDGARFNVKFTKSREVYGKGVKSFCVQIEKSGDGLIWTIDLKPDLPKYIVGLLGLGVSQNRIAKKLRCSPSNVSQAKTKAVKKGLLDEDGNLTEKGRELYGVYKEEDLLNEFES
jgi:hypothetical protein